MIQSRIPAFANLPSGAPRRAVGSAFIALVLSHSVVSEMRAGSSAIDWSMGGIRRAGAGRAPVRVVPTWVMTTLVRSVAPNALRRRLRRRLAPEAGPRSLNLKRGVGTFRDGAITTAFMVRIGGVLADPRDEGVSYLSSGPVRDQVMTISPL